MILRMFGGYFAVTCIRASRDPCDPCDLYSCIRLTRDHHIDIAVGMIFEPCSLTQDPVIIISLVLTLTLTLTLDLTLTLALIGA